MKYLSLDGRKIADSMDMQPQTIQCSAYQFYLQDRASIFPFPNYAKNPLRFATELMPFIPGLLSPGISGISAKYFTFIFPPFIYFKITSLL